jgi:hypothetical protein
LWNSQFGSGSEKISWLIILLVVNIHASVLALKQLALFFSKILSIVYIGTWCEISDDNDWVIFSINSLLHGPLLCCTL